MQFFTEFIDRVVSHFTDYEFRLGMLFVLVLFLVVLAAACIVRRRRRGSSRIVVSEAGGELAVSRRAFVDFVRGVVAEFPLFRLVDAEFVSAGEGIRIRLRLRADAAVELSTQHEALRGRLNSELKARMGLGDRVTAIDMHITALDSPAAANGETAEA